MFLCILWTNPFLMVNPDNLSCDFSAVDCLYVGKYAYTQSDTYHCHMWLEESLSKDMKEINKTADRSEILDYLSYVTMLVRVVIYGLPA